MLGVGLVGAGLMGRNHARVATELGARLVAVAEPDRASGRHVADRYGAALHADPAAVFRDAKVDAVVIATPTVTHHQLAREALEAGKHVLVEKPITTTEDQARDLIGLARKQGLTLAVGHIERHNPVVRWVKERVASRALGDVITVHSRRLSPYPDRIRDVGVVLDLGIHDLDVLAHIASRPPAGVYARAGTHARGAKVEDHASILADFDGGLTGFVELSWLTPTKVRTLMLTCAQGVVECDYMEQTVTITRSRFGEIDPDDAFRFPIDHTVERITLRKEEPLKNEHRDFYAAIREGRPPLVTGDDGLAALRLASAALESARTDARVEVAP